MTLAAEGIPVAVTCRVLGFSKQAFYKWVAAPVTDRDWADAHVINAAMDVHHDDPGVRVPVHRRRVARPRDQGRSQSGQCFTSFTCAFTICRQ